MKYNKFWLTLAELIIWITMSALLIWWFNIIFTSVIKSNWEFAFMPISYFSLEDYEKEIEDFKKIDWNIRRVYKSSDFDFKYWFDAIIIADDSNNSWVLFWAYNKTDDKIAYWNSLEYKKYIPFYMPLKSSEVSLAISESDAESFLNSLDITNVISFDDVYLTKIWFTRLNSQNLFKTDFVYSVDYYTKFEWKDFKTVYNSSEFKEYFYSIIK